MCLYVVSAMSIFFFFTKHIIFKQSFGETSVQIMYQLKVYSPLFNVRLLNWDNFQKWGHVGTKNRFPAHGVPLKHGIHMVHWLLQKTVKSEC